MNVEKLIDDKAAHQADKARRERFDVLRGMVGMHRALRRRQEETPIRKEEEAEGWRLLEGVEEALKSLVSAPDEKTAIKFLCSMAALDVYYKVREKLTKGWLKEITKLPEEPSDAIATLRARVGALSAEKVALRAEVEALSEASHRRPQGRARAWFRQWL